MKYSDFFKTHYEMLMTIMNGLDIGIWITDGAGNVVLVNDKSIKVGGLTREEVLGRNMKELVESGYVLYESSVLKAIESGKTESIVQELGEGGQCLATSTPLFCRGKIDMVLCVERNISEIVRLKEMLSQQKKITERFKTELQDMKKKSIQDEDEMITHNISMIRLKEKAVQIGRIDATVIVIGESGTGKEVIADLIYKNSARNGKPFIKVNCAAIPESLIESEFFGYEKGAFTGASQNGKAGLFEMADGGVLFLDEIGELPLSIQSKLLRVLQDKTIRRIGSEKEISVDVRIIAATNRNLREEMEKGNFRSDLYYRLFVVPVEIPPLRERREDIVPIAHHYLKYFNKLYGMKKVLMEDALGELEIYYWPGNVRELRNVIERLVISGAGDMITKFQVQMCLESREDMTISEALDESDINLEHMVNEYEKHVIVKALEKFGSASQAARKLGVDKSTISRKIKKYKI